MGEEFNTQLRDAESGRDLDPEYDYPVVQSQKDALADLGFNFNG